MRHGIMNMKNIELSRARHLCHFHRQGQGVVGARKQSVVRDLDPMEMKMLLRQLQPNRWSVAEEMNFMAAARQFRSEGRRQNPASADQRKTCNPDFERRRLRHGSV